MSYKDEIVSAFAFDTAKKIEELVAERVGLIEERNKKLEARILNWWVEAGRPADFSAYFEIIEARNGN